MAVILSKITPKISFDDPNAGETWVYRYSDGTRPSFTAPYSGWYHIEIHGGGGAGGEGRGGNGPDTGVTGGSGGGSGDGFYTILSANTSYSMRLGAGAEVGEKRGESSYFDYIECGGGYSGTDGYDAKPDVSNDGNTPGNGGARSNVITRFTKGEVPSNIINASYGVNGGYEPASVPKGGSGGGSYGFGNGGDAGGATFLVGYMNPKPGSDGGIAITFMGRRFSP